MLSWHRTLQFFRIVVVVMFIGRLRLMDIGFELRLVVPALVVLAIIWVVLQAVRASMGLLIVGRVVFSSTFPTFIGNPFLASRILGGLCEELLVRGFFMLQLYAVARTRLGWISLRSAAVTIIVVALGFAMFHVPRLIMDGEPVSDVLGFLVTSIMVGTTLGIVFARSGNVLIAMGIHCFLNLPINMISKPDGLPEYLLWSVELVVMPHSALLCPGSVLSAAASGGWDQEGHRQSVRRTHVTYVYLPPSYGGYYSRGVLSRGGRQQLCNYSSIHRS